MDSAPYNTHREYTIELGCPWYEAQKSYGPPNVNWCEPTICSYINEPANAWSNLAFALTFVILIQRFRLKVIQNFSWCVLFMGAVSFFYHATNNYLTQYIDFLGMFLVTSYLLAFNTRRFQGKPEASFLTLLWFYFSLHTVAFMIFDIVDWPIQPIVAMGILPVLTLDLASGWKQGVLKNYLFFILSALLLALAQTFAIMDIQRIYCEPENLFLHGHVLWHLISAASMLSYGFHMRRVSH